MQNLNLVHLSYLTLCALSDGVIIANSKGQVLFLNKVAERLTGWDIERAKGKFLKDVFIVYHEDGQTRYMPSLVVGLQQMDLPDYLVFRNQAGHIQCYITGTVTHFTDEEIMFSGFVLLFHDVSYLKQRESQIQYDFFHDTLTGLFNRAFFDVEVERLSGERMLPLSVIIADANGLKLVNDVFGHHEGDKLLQKIAKVLRSACRHEDIIARTGGDEFIILLPQVNREEAQAIVDRISRSCNEVEVSPIPLSVSVGTATRENKEDSINSIIELAEERMYTAKLRENSMVRDEMSKFIRKTLETHAGETA
ncbi:MAG TPA: hypothetical protein DIW17_13155, partial [Clostridiales bacterium]|nr:hypothetical protein [Clostridiales bacterium]